MLSSQRQQIRIIINDAGFSGFLSRETFILKKTLNKFMSDTRIAKNVIFLYVRMAVSMIVSLYTVRVVLRVLGVEDYGIYSAVGGIISSLTIFTGALSSASQRFFSVEIGKGNDDGLNRVFNSMTLLYLLAGILILVITETLGVWFLNHKMVIPPDRIAAASVILQCTLISLFVSIIISPFQAIIIAKEDMKIYAYVGVYDAVVKLLIVFLLQIFDTDKLMLYGFLLLLSSISTNLLYWVYFIRKYKEIKVRFKWNTQTVKGILGFSSWSFIGCMAFLFNSQGLNLLLNLFFGPVANAAYNIGNSVKNAVNQLGSNFYVAVRPSLIKEYAANNLGYVRKLFFFSTKVVFCLLFMIMFPIMIETHGILSIWLGEVGDYMVVFVRLMLVWAMLLNISEPITTVVQAANKVKSYHIRVDLFTLITLPLAYVVLKLGGTPAWTFIISIVVLCVAHIIRLFILKSIINVAIREYFVLIVLRIIFAICLSLGFYVLISHLFTSDSTIWLLLRIILEILVAVGLSYSVVLNADERKRIIEMLNNTLRKVLHR